VNRTEKFAAPVRLGTRKSRLALVQSRGIQARLEKAGVPVVLVEVVSSGDRDRKTPLYEIEAPTPGLFTKQLETALLKNEVDLAVHSLKDLPTDQPSGLRVAAVPAREDSGDCLLINPGKRVAGELLELPAGASVGTSSLRREAQLLWQRSDLKIVPLRGNVPTRVQAVKDGKLDAVVLANAGLHRLGLDLSGLHRINLPPGDFVPAPGQGALALECRSDASAELISALRSLNDVSAEIETRVERRILKELHGGCTLPLGVKVTRDAARDRLELRAFLGISRDRKEGAHQWISFHTFDFADRDEENLVRRTVDHFLPLLPVTWKS